MVNKIFDKTLTASYLFYHKQKRKTHENEIKDYKMK